MAKNTVIELEGRDESRDPLAEMLRAGAQQLIQQAVEAELQDLQTSLGPVSVKIPKVRSKPGEAVTFRSALVPA